jgi:ABC-type polysaccharide/polyol phosphate transport system ATPase subunit
VLYPSEAIPERFRRLLFVNPFAPYLNGVHDTLFAFRPVAAADWAAMAAWAAVSLLGEARSSRSCGIPGGGSVSDGGAAAIAVRSVTKVYRRYGRRRHGTLKSAFLSSGERGGPDGVTALSDVSFDVARGQTLGVVGSNGSGKSTLLKLLAGIVRPTRGTLAVSGKLAALLELGAGFHPEISGRENVEITGLLLGLTRRQIVERLPDIVRFAGVEEFLDAPVKTYSSGMAVRLGFAIAAHSDPDVLLVDEVLAVGDEAFSHRALEKFAEFERAGKTLVFVSHDLPLVAERCRRALWLDRGRVAADGPSAETVALYRERVAQEEGGRRLAQPGRGARIGSGEASIRSVRLLDAAGSAGGAPASRGARRGLK